MKRKFSRNRSYLKVIEAGGVEENEENRRKPSCNNNFMKRSKIRYRSMCDDLLKIIQSIF